MDAMWRIGSIGRGRRKDGAAGIGGPDAGVGVSLAGRPSGSGLSGEVAAAVVRAVGEERSTSALHPLRLRLCPLKHHWDSTNC